MKLVEILASEMKEWPEGVTHLTQSNVDREIYNALDGKKESSLDSLNPRFDTSKSHSEGAYPIVTRAQWQAERDRQKGGEWKRHRGNSQPVDEGTYVEVKLRCGDIQQGLANAFLWRRADCDVAANIMKYRVISQPQAEEVEVNVFVGKDVKIEYAYAQEGVEPEHLEWKTMGTAKIDSICDLGSTEAKTDQIDGPIRWRDTVNELDAYIEKFTRERDALIELLASEGFSLIPPVVSVMSEFEGVDMGDWRNWKAGDSVTYIHTSTSSFTDGWQYTLEEVDEDRVSIERDDEGDANGWLTRYFKWHSRQ